MKHIKTITAFIFTLFIQDTSFINAMDAENEASCSEIFKNPNMVISIISQIETGDQLMALKNLCATNKKLHELYWENVGFWSEITNRNYINLDQINKFKNETSFDKMVNECKKAAAEAGAYLNSLFSSTPPEVVSPTPALELTLLAYRHFFTIEKDLAALMNISLCIVPENDRQPHHKRTPSGDIQPYEIKIEMPMHPIDIQKHLCRIRRFEKKFNYEGPFSSSSIFSPAVRYGLWVSEWVLLTYLKGADEFLLKKYPETTTNKAYAHFESYAYYDNIAQEYLFTIFDKLTHEHTANFMSGVKKVMGHYLFTVLTYDSFLQHPPASLLFSLIARKHCMLYLTYPNSNEIIYQGKYKELERMLEYHSYYFGKDFVLNIDSICKKRKPCMQIAIDSKLTPHAWDLYQEYLAYESAYKSEIEGLTKSNS